MGHREDGEAEISSGLEEFFAAVYGIFTCRPFRDFHKHFHSKHIRIIPDSGTKFALFQHGVYWNSVKQNNFYKGSQ